MEMSNITMNATGDDYDPFKITRSLKILLASTTIPIFIIGGFGNISILVAVMKSNQLRTVSNIFTVSLIGLSFLIICYAYPLQQLMDVFIIRSQPWCYLLGTSMLSISVQFTMVLMFVTIERYVTICLPFRAHAVFTPRNVLATVLVLLVYGLFTGMGAGGLIWMGKDDLWMTERRCNLISMIPSREYILVLMVHWLLPLPVMIIIYLRIFVVVRRHIREIAVLLPATVTAPPWKEPGEQPPSTPSNEDTPAGSEESLGEQRFSTSPNDNTPETITKTPKVQLPSIASIANNDTTQAQINRPRGSAPAQETNPIQMKSRRRLIKEAKSAFVLFVIVLTYFFCWVPFSIFAVAGILSGESVSPEGFVIIHCIVYSSGFITPYVYGFGNKKFRVTLIAMFLPHKSGNTSAERRNGIPSIVTGQRT